MSTYRLIGLMWTIMGLLIPSTPLLIMGIVFLVLSLDD